MSQLSLEREKELHKDDVAQLQFDIDQLKLKVAELQAKLVRLLPSQIIIFLPLVH